MEGDDQEELENDESIIKIKTYDLRWLLRGWRYYRRKWVGDKWHILKFNNKEEKKEKKSKHNTTIHFA